MQSKNEYLSQVLALKPSGEKIFLVGGAVRDILLQKPGKDLDLVCSFDTRVIAKKLADQLGGAFFMLDPERNTSRVILFNGEKIRLVFDFARMQGEEILADLVKRDFTINAMAFDLEDPDRIIDPLGGANDLSHKILRSCSPGAFLDDPVRVIRAVRYAVDLNLRIEPQTLVQLKKAVSAISNISIERRRDEFWKILDSSHPDLGLRLCGQLGILTEMGIGGTVQNEKALAHLRSIHQLFTAFERVGKNDSPQGLITTSFLLRMGRFREQIIHYLHELNPAGRTRRSLDLLAGYLQHFSSSEHSRAIQQLSLSKGERDTLVSLYENQTRLDEWEGLPDRRQLYRFFQNAPVDLGFIWLAEKMSEPIAELTQENWLRSTAICERLVQVWLEEPEILHPKPILSGKDLMLELDMGPGPELGRLLDGLIEEQAAGTVQTKKDALQWAEVHQETGNHW